MNANKHDSQRAGHYAQRHGYRAFVPKSLPPDPSLDLTPELASSLERANMQLGRLDGVSQILPNPELFVAMYVRKEAVLSSQIEGTQASLIDILEFEADSAEADMTPDVGEVVCYVKAVHQGLERVHREPIAWPLLCDLHRTLMSQGRGADRQPGKLRSIQNWIGPQGGIAYAVFVPPAPEDLPAALSALEEFMNRPSPLPLLIVAGLVHAQFETIHPFLDGNGRLGRLLLALLLSKHGMLSQPLLYLSEYFKLRRSEYYDRLQAVRDEGNWEGWIRFFLDGVARVSGEATVTARQIIALRESHRQVVASMMPRGTAKAQQFLEQLYLHPVLTIRAAQRLTGLSFATAGKLVQQFVDAGILVETTGQRRNRQFRYRDFLALFGTDGE
jgi:Fic family protein